MKQMMLGPVQVLEVNVIEIAMRTENDGPPPLLPHQKTLSAAAAATPPTLPAARPLLLSTPCSAAAASVLACRRPAAALPPLCNCPANNIPSRLDPSLSLPRSLASLYAGETGWSARLQ